MEKFAQSSADALLGLSTLLGRFKGTAVGGAISSAFSNFMNSGLLAKIGKEQRLKNAPYTSTSMYFTAETAERAKLIATIKKSNATEKEKQKLSAAELADKKKQAELDALKKNFDVDRINLETALANSKDDAEKARIRSLLTIMDEDANSAARRMADLDKANQAKLTSEYLAAVSLNNLSEAARLAAMGVKEFTLGGVPISQYDRYKDSPIFQKAVEIQSQQALDDSEAALAEANAFAARAGVNVGQSGAVNNITINTPVGSEEALTEAVQRAIQQLNRFGYSQNFAGQLP
jgi:hypothetical protein